MDGDDGAGNLRADIDPIDGFQPAGIELTSATGAAATTVGSARP
jgi:hypothetical protein